MSKTETIAQRVMAFHEAIKAHKTVPNVKLVAVSKQQPASHIQEALNAGHRDFGENKLQEAQTHWHDIRHAGDYPDLCLHMIGAVQSNKVANIVGLFDVVHTLDREKIALLFAQEMEKQQKKLSFFIQVNTGNEAQKNGITIEKLPDFLDFCKKQGLDIVGLMCLPPQDQEPSLHFALLKRLADQYGLKQLSMGMSDDFKKALAFGATHIRIGTALFGTRTM